jgi:N6-adenosine-specific RNA methylase IME4
MRAPENSIGDATVRRHVMEIDNPHPPCAIQDPFTLVVADCPWAPRDKLPGSTRGAVKQYPVLTTQELMRFPLPPIADNALLVFWRLASMPLDALDVIKAWGFVPKTEIVWCKITKLGKPWFGMGRTLRASHETAIIAWRGRPKVLNRSTRSVFSAPVPCDPETGKYIHSAKPPEFFALIEPLVAGPRVEMFARQYRPGWASMGNQLPDR